ncbi:hypothetical protein [Anaerorhabdus sp.]|uniref:hypothetical protein n=1 Tax=Anaerorhabdus sp. TaxID=1872524 RepID=UPI002FC6CE47
MNYFIPVFFLFYILMIYMWIFDDYHINENMKIYSSFFIEKDYEFLLGHLGYIDNKHEFHKRVKQSIVVFFLIVLIFFEQLDYRYLLLSFISAILFYKLQYVLLKKKYERKLMEADQQFPFYLNHLCILIQNNTVPVALNKSIQNAPELFRNDISIWVQDIHEGKKKGLIPYLEFNDKFRQVSGLNRIVKTLYNISIASTSKEKMILSLMKITNEKVLNARKDEFNKILDKQALIPWVSFIWVGIVLIASFSAINIGEFLS